MANEEASKSPFMIKLVLLGIAVLVAAVLIWQMASDEPPEEAPPAVQQEEEPAIPEPRPEPEVEAIPPVTEEELSQAEPEPEPEPLPNLADSDAVALAAAEELSPSEEVRDLMVQDNVLLKSVRAVIGLAGGNVVNEYRPLQSPDGAFLVEKLDEPPREDVGQRYRLSEENYQRYDRYVDVITSLDAQNVASVYQRFYPLLEEAYAEHGVDRGSFKEVTLRAIDSMLAAPVLEEQPILIQPKVHFQYEDQRLESLPSPQKLLIRMGPENTQRIQEALREIRAAIEAQPVPTSSN